MERKLRIMKRVLWIGVLCTCLLLVGVFVVFIIMKSFTRDDIVDEDFDTFRYLQINPSKKTSLEGLTKVKRELVEENGFHFSIDEEDNYVLISKFGTTEYECDGTCYCEIFERRTSSIPLLGTLKYLVAAATSITAYNFARMYFKDECVSRFETDCPRDSIRTEIEECQQVKKSGQPLNIYQFINPKTQDILIEIKDLLEQTGVGRDQVNDMFEDSDYDEFNCHGYCMTNQRYEGIVDNAARMGDEVEVEEAPRCEEVVMREILQTFTPSEEFMNQHESLTPDEFANFIFMLKDLNPFCQNIISVAAKYEDKDGNEVGDALENEFPLCVGADENGNNPSVKCSEKIMSQFNEDTMTLH